MGHHRAHHRSHSDANSIRSGLVGQLPAQVDAQHGFDDWLKSYSFQAGSTHMPQRVAADQNAGDLREAIGNAAPPIDRVDANGMRMASAAKAGALNRPGMASGNFDAHIGRPVDPTQRRVAVGCPDEVLSQEIRKRLKDKPQLHAGGISITVAGGIVTLEGTVADQRTSYGIEDIADDTWGVRKVINQLRVNGANAAPGINFPGSLQ